MLSPLNQSGDAEGSKWDQGKVTTPKGFIAAYKQFVEGGLAEFAADPVELVWREATLAQGGADLVLELRAA